MSDVTLAVGGRNYTVACADGQEEHVQRLAKNLLFAALLLADELDEAKKGGSLAADPQFDTGRLAGQLERIALALENAASTLESGRPAS